MNLVPKDLGNPTLPERARLILANELMDRLLDPYAVWETSGPIMEKIVAGAVKKFEKKGKDGVLIIEPGEFYDTVMESWTTHWGQGGKRERRG